MRFRFLFVLLLIAGSSQAQSEHEFTAGLAVAQCHRYGREAVVTDQLAYQLFTGAFKKPRLNERLFTGRDGRDVVWTEIKVDSTGRFRGEALMNGYIYLTYDASSPQKALLNVSGNVMSYFNGEPRGGDIYNDGWMTVPVMLKKGLNEILIRCSNFSRYQGVKARLLFPQGMITLNTDDATLPHIVVGRSGENLLGAVVIINSSDKSTRGLSIAATLNGKTVNTPLAEVPPNSIRKTPFYFDPAGVTSRGDHLCQLQVKQNGKVLDEKSVKIPSVDAGEHHSYTFISDIDGSVQYYSVAPDQGNNVKPALFLSVHGAGVQAIGQARAYKPKDWGVLVAPTNRRPRGFNWEDWGRIDALEVLDLARKRFDPDPEKIYLTGHSMGGHGTWYLGATYPDKWAAIAPCAGYPTLTGYGSADGRIPDSARSAMERILLRASNASNVIDLAANYKSEGVYIFHGDADRTVPVTFARQMRDILGAFHPDFSYYEYPGGSHWFGNESVDWGPLFEYFRWHTLKADSAVQKIHFITANPGVSSTFRWASIIQQTQPLLFSEINLERDKKAGAIAGSTKNVARLKLATRDFVKGAKVTISLDSSTLHHTVNGDEIVVTRNRTGWAIGEPVSPNHKNPQRSGTFKEAFNHRMLFVYGTAGNAAEDRWAYNKARYDAEVWYYRGNGAVDIIADQMFDASKYRDRSVILYGNSATNSAWEDLLKGCPIQVTRDRITVDGKVFQGSDLGIYFIWPRPDSELGSVGVVSGTGLPGLSSTEANQYFAAGSGFPDYIIFSVEMLRDGADGVKSAGFFNNEWQIKND